MNNKVKIALISVSAITIALVSSLVVYKNSNIFAKEQDYTSDYSLTLVNTERASKNLKTLEWNSQLEKAAQDKVNDIFTKGYFDHTAPDGTKAWDFILSEGYDYRVAGENLAADYSNIDDAFAAWKKSPTHLENILSDKFTDYAISQKEGVLNGQDTTVYVQLFASK